MSCIITSLPYIGFRSAIQDYNAHFRPSQSYNEWFYHEIMSMYVCNYEKKNMVIIAIFAYLLSYSTPPHEYEMKQ